MSYCCCMKSVGPPLTHCALLLLWRSCLGNREDFRKASQWRATRLGEVCVHQRPGREGKGTGNRSEGRPAPHSCLSCRLISQSRLTTPALRTKGIHDSWMGRNSNGDLTLPCRTFLPQLPYLLNHFTNVWQVLSPSQALSYLLERIGS